MARLIVFTLSIATLTRLLAQAPPAPVGNWQSARNDIFISPLHPVVTRAEFYLNIYVANDGSFRGEWGEYTCGSSIRAYGYTMFPCRFSPNNVRVSGRFGPTGQGVIELQKLGRSDFTWSMPSISELSIDLPRNWQGSEAVFHRARMTRDGKPKPAPPKPDDSALFAPHFIVDSNTLRASPSFNGRSRVAFLDVPAGTLTLTVMYSRDGKVITRSAKVITKAGAITAVQP